MIMDLALALVMIRDLVVLIGKFMKYNRYTSVLWKFLPLVKSNNGELMYHTDHEKIVDELQKQLDKKDELLTSYANDYHRIYDRLDIISEKRYVLHTGLVMSICVNIALLIITIILYVN